jgi:DNA-binding CsgD family transcriptional regulator
MNEQRECRGCGADLTGTHGPRIWCSEKCRKDQYGGECENCGAKTDGSNGRANAPKLCRYCAETKYAERNQRLIEMWEAGVPTWYIAEQLGMSESTVTGWIHDDRRRNGASHSVRRLPGNYEQRRERWRQMIAWRKEGKRSAEIGELLGVSAAAVDTMFSTARRKGFEVPPAPLRS